MEALIPIAIGGSLLSAGARQTAGSQAQLEGQITAEQMELEARQEEVAAKQREADRKDALARAMASQIASAGARGIAVFEGSPLTILEEDIRQESKATERDLFNTRLAVLSKRAGAGTARQRGLMAKRTADIEAVAGLLGDTTKIAMVA